MLRLKYHILLKMDHLSPKSLLSEVQGLNSMDLSLLNLVRLLALYLMLNLFLFTLQDWRFNDYRDCPKLVTKVDCEY